MLPKMLMKSKMIEASSNELLRYIEEEITKLDKAVSHYFTCKGCNDCKAVKHKNLLANNEKDFRDEVQAVRKKLL